MPDPVVNPDLNQDPNPQASEPTVPPVAPAQPNYNERFGGDPNQPDPLEALKAELAALREQVNPKPIVPESEQDWLDLLSKGKKSEGEEALAKRLAPVIESATLAKAMQMFQMEREIAEFTQKIRVEAADVMPMEQFITAAVQARLSQMPKASNPADYVKSYKDAVNAEIENARKLFQSVRGDGAAQAVNRQQQVQSVPQFQPNGVTQNREQASSAQPESNDDYLAKRMAKQAGLRGLGQTA